MKETVRASHNEILPIADGVPYKEETVERLEGRSIAGAYASWGTGLDNESLPGYLRTTMGIPLLKPIELSSKGFNYRSLTLELTEEEHVEVELEVGTRLLKSAAYANGWEPGEVDAVFAGGSAPPFPSYTVEIANRAGIREEALKYTICTACDSSGRGLYIALNNPELRGKKVLVGGIENLSKLLVHSEDEQALQLFANGGGIVGLVPGDTMIPIVSRTKDIEDVKRALQVKMTYYHEGKKLVETYNLGKNHILVSGDMPSPEGSSSVVMQDNRGMLRLFAYNTAEEINKAIRSYEKIMEYSNIPPHIDGVGTHHANRQIGRSQDRYLLTKYRITGINMEKNWVVSEHGNVSAASLMISLLKQADKTVPGSHWLIVGYGAGGHYDVMVVEMGSAENI